jgi:DHA1 family quinolone resistance protein-like MFS transporter
MRKFHLNRTIILLILSDIFFLTGFGLVDPIIAIFIDGSIEGGSIFTAGIASTIFFVTKSLIQLPFSKYVDGHDNKIHWLVLGMCLVTCVPVIYLLAPNIWFIYLAQFIYGVGSGLAYPTWLGLWSINLDKNHESYEWSLYSTLTGIGTAISASAGAAMADFLGFRFSFVVVGIMSIIGCIVLIVLEKQNQRKTNLVKLSA